MTLDGQGTRAIPTRIPDNASFFQNRACEHFPCHEGVDPDSFNCLFCYCPLYALGDACGGDFRYTASGVKDCTGCTILHDGEGGAELVKARFADLKRLAAHQDEDGDEAGPWI